MGNISPLPPCLLYKTKYNMEIQDNTRTLTGNLGKLSGEWYPTNPPTPVSLLRLPDYAKANNLPPPLISDRDEGEKKWYTVVYFLSDNKKITDALWETIFFLFEVFLYFL